jgi:hypothetical protein
MTLCIVMKYYKGGDLENFMIEKTDNYKKLIDIDIIVAYMIQITSCVQYVNY